MPQLEPTEYFEGASENLPKEQKKKLAKALRFLADNPRHPGLRTKPIKGLPKSWAKIYEARIDDDYRLTYQRGEGDVLILRNVGEHEIIDKDP